MSRESMYRLSYAHTITPDEIYDGYKYYKCGNTPSFTNRKVGTLKKIVDIYVKEKDTVDITLSKYHGVNMVVNVYAFIDGKPLIYEYHSNRTWKANGHPINNSDIDISFKDNAIAAIKYDLPEIFL